GRGMRICRSKRAPQIHCSFGDDIGDADGPRLGPKVVRCREASVLQPLGGPMVDDDRLGSWCNRVWRLTAGFGLWNSEMLRVVPVVAIEYLGLEGAKSELHPTGRCARHDRQADERLQLEAVQRVENVSVGVGAEHLVAQRHLHQALVVEREWLLPVPA